MITCLIITQLYFATDMRAYSTYTEQYPKIMAIIEAENINLDEPGFRELMGERIPFRESSLGLPSQLFGDDGKSLGSYQIQIHWSLVRHHPLGWTEIDSLVMALDLLTDPYFSQREYQQTFYEHMRYWRNKYGKTGAALYHLTIRSCNRGLDYFKAMDPLGDAYIKAVDPLYPNCNHGVNND